MNSCTLTQNNCAGNNSSCPDQQLQGRSSHSTNKDSNQREPEVASVVPEEEPVEVAEDSVPVAAVAQEAADLEAEELQEVAVVAASEVEVSEQVKLYQKHEHNQVQEDQEFN